VLVPTSASKASKSAKKVHGPHALPIPEASHPLKSAITAKTTTVTGTSTKDVDVHQEARVPVVSTKASARKAYKSASQVSGPKTAKVR
jgi:hypothetical protein